MHAVREEKGKLDLDAENLVAEGVHSAFVGEGEGLPVVFDGVFGLEIVVGVVEGAAEFVGDGFGEGREFADEVALVDVVYVEQTAEAEDYATGFLVGVWVEIE